MIWVRAPGIEETERPEAAICVLNKIDLLPRDAMNRLIHDAQESDCLYTSAASGEGVAELAAEIVRRLAGESPAPGEGVPFTVEQVEGIRSAHRAMARGEIPAALSQLAALVH